MAELLLGSVLRYIDVGANDGITCSNCIRFALQGAEGLSFEPDPANYRRLRALMRFNRRVRCIGEGLSDRDGTLTLRSDGLLSSIESTDDPGLSALLEAYRLADAPEVSIRVSRLSTWLERSPDFVRSDLMSIDVEGHELCVLRGIDWHRTPKPARCLIIETHAYGDEKSWVHRDFDEISGLLQAHAYRRVCASSNNTFWLHAEDADHARLAAAHKQFPKYRWENTWT